MIRKWLNYTWRSPLYNTSNATGRRFKVTMPTVFDRITTIVYSSQNHLVVCIPADIPRHVDCLRVVSQATVQRRTFNACCFWSILLGRHWFRWYNIILDFAHVVAPFHPNGIHKCQQTDDTAEVDSEDNNDEVSSCPHKLIPGGANQRGTNPNPHNKYYYLLLSEVV